MSQFFTPFAAAIAAAPAVARQQVIARARQAKRRQMFAKDSAAVGDTFEHVIEQNDRVEAAGDHDQAPPRRHPGDEPPADPEADDGNTDPHLDVTG